jgi:hypothetical protein
VPSEGEPKNGYKEFPRPPRANQRTKIPTELCNLTKVKYEIIIKRHPQTERIEAIRVTHSRMMIAVWRNRH